MTPAEIQFWKQVAQDLDLEIDTPFQFEFPNGGRICASALVKNFGYARGMVVDADFSILAPHTDALLQNDFGFSTCGTEEQYDRADMIEVLADWGWSGSFDKRPDWLP